VPEIGQVDAAAAQAAVEALSRRVVDLVRSARRPAAPALRAWDVTGVAAHLSHALDGVTAMAEGGGGLLSDLWELSSLTEALVAGEAERDLAVLAGRIEATTARFLSIVRSENGDGRRRWLVEGIEHSVTTLTCHVLNELVVHGRDIAMAEGVPWPISRSEGALVVCGFLLPVLASLGPAMVDQEAAAGVRATLELRVRGGCRAVLRFDDGDFSVTGAPSSGPVDCHLLVDPGAFMLVAWGRISQWHAIPRGQLLAWGRRPWLGLRLRALVRNP
jgi:hypothetical protein